MILLILILLVALFLRFQSIWYIEFKADEAGHSFLTVDFVYKGIFPLVSDISSKGSHNPAMVLYLLSMPFSFSRNPVVASGFVAMLNVLAICLCFFFCREFFNQTTALIATAFFAVNPWVILYSRKIWPPGLLPFFVMCFFYSLYRLVTRKQDAYILLACVFLAICIQLHLSCACYLILVVVLTTAKARIRPLYYIMSAAAFLLLYTPYIVYEARNNFSNRFCSAF